MCTPKSSYSPPPPPSSGLGSQRLANVISTPDLSPKENLEACPFFPTSELCRFSWGMVVLRQGCGRAWSQLAPALAMRSSKALSWSLLCNSKTSLMSFSSKPISLNLLIN